MVSKLVMRRSSVSFACLGLAAYIGCSPDTGGSGVTPRGNGGSSGADADTTGGTGATATGGSGAMSSGGSGAINVDASGGSSGTLNADSGCASGTVNSTLEQANLLFVIDKSGSMNCNLPEAGQTTLECEQSSGQKENAIEPSKWEVTRPALRDAIGALKTAGNASVGISMFPTDNRCGVKVTPDVAIQRLDDTHYTGIDGFLGTVSPIGSTPIAGSTILAFEYLRQQIVSGTLVGNHFVVLLTDGAESCSAGELANLLSVHIPTARDSFNIRTFVIGAPGSEPARATLSQMAWEGGTARSPTCDHAAGSTAADCHYDMTTSNQFAQDLANALAAISGEALTCDIDVPPRNPDGGEVNLDLVNVDIDGERVFKVAGDCATVDGWQYNADRTKITLCGPACEKAKLAQTIHVILGCRSEVH
jgi:hypothetical protein